MTAWETYSEGTDVDPVEKWRADMHALVDDAARNVTELQKWERLARPDSFPTRSMGGASSPTNEVDEDGTPVPQHSDPVLVAVVERQEWADKSARRALLNAMRSALLELNRGVNASLKVLRPVKERIKDSAPDADVWCVAHLAHGMHEPFTRKRSRVCDFCADWFADPSKPGDWPCKEILDRHARGQKITSAVLVEVFAPAKPKKGKRRK